MMILGTERDKRIAALRLPEPVLRLVHGEEVHPELSSWCRQLAFSLEPEDFAPAGLDLVPLWEGESSITGFFEGGDGKRVFIRYDVEYINDYTVVGGTIEAALADVLNEYIDEDKIDEVAMALGFSTEQLMGR